MKALMGWSTGKHTVQAMLRLFRFAALCHALLVMCFPTAALPTFAGLCYVLSAE